MDYNCESLFFLLITVSEWWEENGDYVTNCIDFVGNVIELALLCT